MNDTRRRMLTEYLSECQSCLRTWASSGLAFRLDNQCSCRNFDTAQDMVDLVRKIVERGDWEGFVNYFSSKNMNVYLAGFSSSAAWLITDPARTCELIAEWMEKNTDPKCLCNIDKSVCPVHPAT